MKKYYQAALAITATVSLIALLFYRHEYNKLRFVLQVVNYFGTPSATPNETITFTVPPADFFDPSSSWQRLTNDLHVFSSYKIHNEVRSIAFGTNEKLKDTFDCRIFYNSENPESILGEFSTTITSEDDTLDVAYIDGTKYYGLLLTCKSSVTLNDKNVFGVQFLEKTKKKSNLVLKVREINLKDKVNNGTVTCITPPKAGHTIKKVDMVAFIAFHQKIGMEHFVVYDFGISDDFHSKLILLAQISGMNFTYSKVAWNFPFEGVHYRVLRHIIETDCLFRSFGRAKLAVTLTWNEFVSLKYHTSLANLVRDYDDVKGQTGNLLALDTLTLCAEQSPGGNVSAPVILYSTSRLRGENNKEAKHVYQLTDDKVFGKRNFKGPPEDMITVYKYENCNGDQEVIENQELRFVKEAVESKIFQLYINGKSLSNRL